MRLQDFFHVKPLTLHVYYIKLDESLNQACASIDPSALTPYMYRPANFNGVSLVGLYM